MGLFDNSGGKIRSLVRSGEKENIAELKELKKAYYLMFETAKSTKEMDERCGKALKLVLDTRKHDERFQKTIE